jgi:GNAT superfamily N-acetyltransferase
MQARRSLFVRPIDLENDRERLIRILQRNLPDVDHAARYRWRYLENPAGRAYAWFLCDGSDDRAVGAAALFPRYTWIADKLVRCGQVGDFAVDAPYRSLGPALLLQRTTFAPVDSGDLAFCYDCTPHEPGMATFRRLGLRAACRAHRFMKPLRVDGLVRKRMPAIRRLGAMISVPLNGALRVRDWGTGASGDLSIVAHAEPFGNEFTELDEFVAAASDLIRNRRSAQDLEWRLRRDPDMICEVMTARSAGRLVGFAAYCREHERAHLVDYSASSPMAAKALLRAVTHRAREQGLEAVDSLAVLPTSTPWSLRRAGYIQRELSAGIVPYAKSDLTDTLATKSWSLATTDVMG